jgi:hypothetical protein
MKRNFLIVIIGLMLLSFGCSKSVSNDSDPIVFTTSAATSNISVASNFAFTLKITSRISIKGLSVQVTAAEEVTGLSVSPQPPIFTTTVADNSSSVINLPQQKWVIATVKITDANNAKNTASKSFRVIYK